MNKLKKIMHEIKWNVMQNHYKKFIKPRSKILDVGCGNGWLASSVLSNGVKVISMDISTVNPSKALKNQPHEK